MGHNHHTLNIHHSKKHQSQQNKRKTCRSTTKAQTQTITIIDQNMYSNHLYHKHQYLKVNVPTNLIKATYHIIVIILTSIHKGKLLQNNNLKPAQPTTQTPALNVYCKNKTPPYTAQILQCCTPLSTTNKSLTAHIRPQHATYNKVTPNTTFNPKQQIYKTTIHKPYQKQTAHHHSKTQEFITHYKANLNRQIRNH
eukprot:gene3204-2186_t